MKRAVLLSCLFVFLLNSPVCLAANDPADTQFHVRVLVRNFKATGVLDEWGELAAETIAAAVDERGLAQSLRPTYNIESEWGLAVGGVVVDAPRTRYRRYQKGEGVDVYAAPERRLLIKEKKAPVSDYFIEGTLSAIETTWWLKADIFERGTRKKLKSASASGEGSQGLLVAAQKVAAQLETVYALQVVSNRAEAVLRAVELQRVQRPLAAARLERMHEDWPHALEPVAARLSLESTQTVPDPKALVTWAAKVIESLRIARPESQRFLLRLNLDPYDILADQYEAEGKRLAAASVHLEGAELFPGDRHSHWLKAARLQAGLGRDREAATAYEGALNLKPIDPETILELGLLLEKLGDRVAAKRCFNLFLKHAPRSPRTAEIRAKLDSLAPAVLPAP